MQHGEEQNLFLPYNTVEQNVIDSEQRNKRQKEMTIYEETWNLMLQKLCMTVFHLLTIVHLV